MLELAINSKGRDVGKGSETQVIGCFCITLGPGLNKDIKTSHATVPQPRSNEHRGTFGGFMLQTY